MKILIDVTQIPKKKGGVGIYALNLVQQIAKLDFENDYYILIQDDEHSFDSLEREKFNFIKVQSRFSRIVSFRFFLEQCVIPYIAIKNKIDIVHSLHYSFPLLTFGAKKCVTVHDMTFFKLPGYHKIIKRCFFRIFIRLAGKMADRIISVSESTAKDFILITNASEDKISVVHLGSMDWSTSPFPNKKIENVKKKYKIEGEYILYVGMIEPRKNVPNLILAYERLLKVNKNHHLVIVGRKGWGHKQVFRLVDDLGLYEKIIFTGFVEEEDKLYLIKGAKAFVYPSIYEGFGLPVLEALSLGVPTVTSNVSSLPEVAGDAALLVDPTSVDELYRAIKALLDDEKMCQDLKNKAFLQARKFSWARTAEETIRVYQSMANTTSGFW